MAWKNPIEAPRTSQRGVTTINHGGTSTRPTQASVRPIARTARKTNRLIREDASEARAVSGFAFDPVFMMRGHLDNGARPRHCQVMITSAGAHALLPRFLSASGQSPFQTLPGGNRSRGIKVQA